MGVGGQGLKQVPSGHRGQVDSPYPGQAIFERYLSEGQAGIQVFLSLGWWLA